MGNYWLEKDQHEKDGWIYLSTGFRIKHNDFWQDWIYDEEDCRLVKLENRVPMIWTDGADEIHPHNIVSEQKEAPVKCPMCGRIKAVQKREEHLYYCSYCQMLFDDREE